MDVVHQTEQRQLVHWEWVGLQVVSCQSGITDRLQSVTCAVICLCVITACRDAQVCPYAHTHTLSSAQCQGQRKSYHHDSFTTTALHLVEMPGEDAIAP